MRLAGAIIAATLLVAAPFARTAEAAPTMAFGYLVNRSGDAGYDYLETIFPNAFASAIQNIFMVSVLKPAQINAILKKRQEALARTYRPHELTALTERLSADYFIYGSFITLPGDRIKISLSLYSRGLNRIFSFTNTGTMETEIFRLVDRITAILIDFLGSGNYFMARIVPKGARIGVVTNLDGAELNYLYHALLGGGYRVASIQGNDLRNPHGDLIEQFRCIAAAENSYQIVSDPAGARFLHGGWTGERYARAVRSVREAHRIYDVDYLGTKFAALDRLAAKQGVDTLLIVGFNALRTRAWVRCLDIRGRDLIWMQSNLSGGLPRICEKMIAGMSADVVKK